MALDTHPKPYGLSDIKLTSIDGADQVDLPAATKLTFKERVKSAEGVGDDKLDTVVSVREGIEWELEATGGVVFPAGRDLVDWQKENSVKIAQGLITQ